MTRVDAAETLIVHEWLTNFAGSEQVVDGLRAAFPEAPVATTMCWGPRFPEWDVVTTGLQRFCHGPSSHVRCLPTMPAAWRSTTLPETELTITSFHTFSTQARVRSRRHVVYCHTPPRFAWLPQQFNLSRPKRWAATAMAGPWRVVDRRSLAPADVVVANSNAVSRRIERCYGRSAAVVPPPVQIERFRAARATVEPSDEFLLVSRLVPYKRVDLAIDAFAQLRLPLAVVGGGRAAASLQARAPDNVRFVGRLSDEELAGRMASSRALVFPAEEDFGIVAVEAMAAGLPVVAFGAGGILDSVTPERSGVLFEEPTAGSLAAAVRRCCAHDWDRDDISATVERFSTPHFVERMRGLCADQGLP